MASLLSKIGLHRHLFSNFMVYYSIPFYYSLGSKDRLRFSVSVLGYHYDSFNRAYNLLVNFGLKRRLNIFSPLLFQVQSSKAMKGVFIKKATWTKYAYLFKDSYLNKSFYNYFQQNNFFCYDISSLMTYSDSSFIINKRKYQLYKPIDVFSSLDYFISSYNSCLGNLELGQNFLDLAGNIKSVILDDNFFSLTFRVGPRTNVLFSHAFFASKYLDNMLLNYKLKYLLNFSNISISYINLSNRQGFLNLLSLYSKIQYDSFNYNLNNYFKSNVYNFFNLKILFISILINYLKYNFISLNILNVRYINFLVGKSLSLNLLNTTFFPKRKLYLFRKSKKILNLFFVTSKISFIQKLNLFLKFYSLHLPVIKSKFRFNKMLNKKTLSSFSSILLSSPSLHKNFNWSNPSTLLTYGERFLNKFGWLYKKRQLFIKFWNNYISDKNKKFINLFCKNINFTFKHKLFVLGKAYRFRHKRNLGFFNYNNYSFFYRYRSTGLYNLNYSPYVPFLARYYPIQYWKLRSNYYNCLFFKINYFLKNFFKFYINLIRKNFSVNFSINISNVYLEIIKFFKICLSFFNKRYLMKFNFFKEKKLKVITFYKRFIFLHLLKKLLFKYLYLKNNNMGYKVFAYFWKYYFFYNRWSLKNKSFLFIFFSLYLRSRNLFPVSSSYSIKAKIKKEIILI